MVIQFRQIEDANRIWHYRTQYLESLPECQEQFLEFLLRDATFYEILSSDGPAGYCAVDSQRQLLEYWLFPHSVQYSPDIFKVVLVRFAPVRAFCKSFDAQLMSASFDIGASVSVAGYNFRSNWKEDTFTERSDITIRIAGPKDEETVFSLREELFENDEEIIEFLEKEQIYLFSTDNETAGIGIISQIIPAQPYYDIGMGVAPAFRARGVGTYIISYLKNLCDTNGWTAVCGCDAENIGSRLTLQKAGFVPHYRMLEFTY